MLLVRPPGIQIDAYPVVKHDADRQVRARMPSAAAKPEVHTRDGIKIHFLVRIIIIVITSRDRWRPWWWWRRWWSIHATGQH
jgi:hypothetical protein